jgi:hypothetical protein
MGYPSLLKLAPYLLMFALAIGAFFYIKNLGKISCESEVKTVIIEQGKKDIDVENRQSKIRSNRGNYDLDKRLQSGTF